jgi:hypothetical protein
MMNRILKRPMFRMGGRSDDGIMSVRPKYQEGGDVGFFTKVMDAINPPSGKILSRIAEKNKPGLSPFQKFVENVSNKPLEFRTQAEANEFLEANPENIRPIKLLSNDKIINLESTNDTGQPSNVPGTPIVPNVQKKLEAGTGEQSDQDLIKSYMDMFSEAMGESEEDVSRQRYLELAKFGANLLGQPGGDLVGSIGKAAAPSIQGLAEGAARKSAANREIKLAGLKTAIAQMDDPTADKIKTLARLSGVSEKEVAKLMISGSDDSSLDRIKLTVDAIGGDVGSSAALSIAQALEEEGAVLAQARPIEIDKKTKLPKEDVSDGYYYDEKGILYKVEKGKPSTVKIK